MNQQTEQAHKDLKHILLAGRILVNGLPLTGNELGVLIQEEQMLYEKASRLDAAQELAAKPKKPVEVSGKGPKVLPINTPVKK